jgi:hypothetical protein
MADETVYMTHQEMLALREKADTRDQPGSLERGQRIIGWSMWKTGALGTHGLWRAVCVLADGTRLEIVEGRGREM